jgi:hypothetical protein
MGFLGLDKQLSDWLLIEPVDSLQAEPRVHAPPDSYRVYRPSTVNAWGKGSPVILATLSAADQRMAPLCVLNCTLTCTLDSQMLA